LATTKASPVETATSETPMKMTTAVETTTTTVEATTAAVETTTTTTTVAASAPAVASCQSCVS
jgi:hypothetical protein